VRARPDLAARRSQAAHGATGGRGAVLAAYTGVVVILVVATILAGALLGIHLLLGPRRTFAEKTEPFECGERPVVSPKQRFSVRFYIVAMLFILFDVEAVFFYPWGALFTELGWFGFVEMLTFTGVLAAGLAYVWMKGALEW
jgi:NADH-quinone oxidoreductase subunit A